MTPDQVGTILLGGLIGGLANSVYSERKVGRRLQRLETLVAVIANNLGIKGD